MTDEQNDDLIVSIPDEQSSNQEDHSDDAESDSSWLDTPLFSPESADMMESQNRSLFARWRSPGLRPVVPRSSRRPRDCSSRLVFLWDDFVSKSKLIILIVTLCVLWPFGVVSYKSFSQSTDSTFHPIPNTPSARAQQAFAESYKNDWSNPLHPIFIVALESGETLTNTTSPAYQVARSFSIGLDQTLNTTCWDGLPCPSNETWTRVSSFYSFTDLKMSALANGFATRDGKTSLIQVQYLLPSNETDPKARIRELQDKIQEYGSGYNSNDTFTVSYTGLKLFQSDLMDSSKTELRKMDAIVLPLALFLLGVVLPNGRAGVVWVIPLVTIISTVCAWSIVMRFIASKTQITQFTPSVMMSLTLGMGVDYTLFLLSRYLEKDMPQRIPNMIHNGGNVILTSGITLMCTFLGLCFLPLKMLKSIGIGASVAIGSALVVNLTVVPALLHTRLGKWIIKPPAPEQQQQQADQPEEDNVQQALEEPLMDTTESHPEDTEPQGGQTEKSMWFLLAKNLLHPTRSIVILVGIILLLLPVAWHAAQIKSSISFDLLLPSKSPSLQTFHSLGKKLGWGRLSPYRILFNGRNSSVQMTSNHGFDLVHKVIDELIAIDSKHDAESRHAHGARHGAVKSVVGVELEPASFVEVDMMDEWNALVDHEVTNVTGTNSTTMYNGVAVLHNAHVPHTIYSAAKICGSMKRCTVEKLRILDYIDRELTTDNGYVTYVVATLGVNPFSNEGVAWLISARETIARLEKSGALGGVEVYIEGGAGIAYDAVQAVYRAFPTAIVRTMVVVFLLMAFFFRSIITPLRSIVSIGLTLSFVFGLGVLVYQHGILNWTGIQSWSTLDPSEICWLSPITAFTIIVGLALDYDVFLISRILEYRMEGYDHKSSIVAGVEATGSIITAAGVIMAVAFGGLMLSSSPALYQLSFFLTTAVLLDTFVIRTLIVPITMGYTGKFSWWPRQLPRERTRLLEERLDEQAGGNGAQEDQVHSGRELYLSVPPEPTEEEISTGSAGGIAASVNQQ